MLTDKEKEEIQAEIRQYDRKRAACVEALKIVQQHRGWVSDESLNDVASILEMTPHELDSIATFYNMIYRRPVGSHVMHMCDSISCWIMAQHEVYEHVKKSLGIDWGETTADSRFTLLPVPCLGACDHAPAMMIDRELYLDLTPEKVEEILGRFRS